MRGGTPVRGGGRRLRRRRPWAVRLLLPLVVVLGAVFLYARPLANYSETRADLKARQASVDALLERKRELEALHARTTSREALARQARRIGLVRPGEELFIVKGIPAWRRSLAPPAP